MTHVKLSKKSRPDAVPDHVPAIAWDAVVTSPLRRAEETGRIIAADHGLDFAGTDPRLVEIDWGVEDPTDTAQLAGISPGALVDTACDQLQIAGYTLWVWDDGEAIISGAIAARDDDEGMRVIGHALGLDLRPGNG